MYSVLSSLIKDQESKLDLKNVILFQKFHMPFFKENEDEIVLKFYKDYPLYFNKIRFNEESIFEENPREIKIKRDGFKNKKELILTKIIRARKSGTILFENDLFSKMAEERTKQIKVSDLETESTFKVSLFDKSEKFERFDTLDVFN